MKKIIILLLAMLWLSACERNITPDAPIANEDSNDYPDLGFSENDVVKGLIRIKLKKEPAGQIAVRSVGGQVTTGIRALDSSATTLGITHMERTFPYAGKYEGRTRRAGLHLWYDVSYSEEVTATRAVNEIALIEDIDIVCPVRKAQTRATAFPWNDPSATRQWNLYNPGTESWQTEGADIRLKDVWQQYNGHPSVIIAVMDEGVDTSHPDLRANLWTNPGEIAENGIDDDGNGYIDDVHGYNFYDDSPKIVPEKHGTHVAGIIGAVNHNNIGVCGVVGGDGTPNSGAKIMCCQIIKNGYSNSTARGIKYGADMGAVISQNSWGYTGDIDPADKEAIDYFIENAGCDDEGNQLKDSPMKGGIVLFATNNFNTPSHSNATPADYEKVIGVAAIGPQYKKASYSNYGDYIDICAPGGERGATEAGVYSTGISGSYTYLFGASMACPHVSGVAALIIEKYGVEKPGFTASQLQEILLSTAYNIDSYNPSYIGQLGNGCVNAAAALQAELPSDKSFLLKTNPVTDGTVSFRVNQKLAGNAVITIVNSTGNTVLRKSMIVKPYVTISLDVRKLSGGYYTLQYECGGSCMKEKFINY